MISLVHFGLNCSFILFVSFHKLLIVYILLIGRWYMSIRNRLI